MPSFPSRSKIVLAGALCALAAACASVQHAPASLTPAAAESATTALTLRAPMHIVFDTGYTRALAAGSQWLLVGTIAQGQVYRPYKNVFTLEGAHMHEAYLVVDNGRLVGFYLPAEGGFSSLERKLAITIN
jgi:hypothetical protein